MACRHRWILAAAASATAFQSAAGDLGITVEGIPGAVSTSETPADSAFQRAAFTLGNTSGITQAYRAGLVDCGGHYAEHCGVCPGENEEIWCHGDCIWMFGACQAQPFWVWWTPRVVRGYWWQFSGSWCCLGWIMCCYAAVYKQRVVDKFPHKIEDVPRDAEGSADREYGLFDVFKNPNTLLWSLFCTPVLAAKNYDVGGVCGFWPSCMCLFWATYSPFYMLAVTIRAILSSKLQRNLGHQSSCCSEWLQGLCCYWCAVGRESLEVDDAESMRVTCLFETESTAWIPSILSGEKDRTCTERFTCS